MNGELGILNWVQTVLHSAPLDALMVFVTRLGNGGAVWLALGLVLLLRPNSRRLGVSVLISLGLAALAGNAVLKPLVARPRPFTVNPAARLLIPPPGGYSFPSGHTGASFAAAGALWFGRSRLRWPAMALAALIGFSRVYLYVHYPTDVLAGAVLGLAMGRLGSLAAERLFAKAAA